MNRKIIKVSWRLEEILEEEMGMGDTGVESTQFQIQYNLRNDGLYLTAHCKRHGLTFVVVLGLFGLRLTGRRECCQLYEVWWYRQSRLCGLDNYVFLGLNLRIRLLFEIYQSH